MPGNSPTFSPSEPAADESGSSRNGPVAPASGISSPATGAAPGPLVRCDDLDRPGVESRNLSGDGRRAAEGSLLGCPPLLSPRSLVSIHQATALRPARQLATTFT